MPDLIDISDLDKAAVLAALYNNSAPMGAGFMQAIDGSDAMTLEHARSILAGDIRLPDGGFIIDGKSTLRLDYVYGRPIKIDFAKDEINPWGYDSRNRGEGDALRIIKKLRETGDIGDGIAGTQQFRDRVVEKGFEALDLTETDTEVKDGLMHLGGSDIAVPLKASVAHVVDRVG